MDGHFVKNMSFGPSTVRALRKKYPDIFLDVHLMLDELDVMTPLFVEAGASQVTIHAEVEPQLLHSRLSQLRKAGVRAGVALAPVTPVEQVRMVLPIVDVVLLLSVTPGFGGQEMIGGVLEKARDLARCRAVEDYGYNIEIDGGVNAGNAALAAAAGCDVLVMGNAVFGGPDPAGYLTGVRDGVTQSAVKEAIADASFR
jgi:ribulose-phosphate 3-epimerase